MHLTSRDNRDAAELYVVIVPSVSTW